MPKSLKIQSGDIFAVPLSDGRFGIAQVVFSHYSRLMMGVLAIRQDQTIPENLPYLLPMNWAEKMRQPVLFTGNHLLKDGTWPIIGHRPLDDAAKRNFYFVIANTLYRYPDCMPPQHSVRLISLVEHGNWNRQYIASVYDIADFLATGGYDAVQLYTRKTS